MGYISQPAGSQCEKLKFILMEVVREIVDL